MRRGCRGGPCGKVHCLAQRPAPTPPSESPRRAGRTAPRGAADPASAGAAVRAVGDVPFGQLGIAG
nr:hypothetical protein RVX_1052 [Nitratidesulfovibrio sp. HK-II]